MPEIYVDMRQVAYVFPGTYGIPDSFVNSPENFPSLVTEFKCHKAFFCPQRTEHRVSHLRLVFNKVHSVGFYDTEEGSASPVILKPKLAPCNVGKLSDFCFGKNGSTSYCLRMLSHSRQRHIASYSPEFGQRGYRDARIGINPVGQPIIKNQSAANDQNLSPS